MSPPPPLATAATSSAGGITKKKKKKKKTGTTKPKKGLLLGGGSGGGGGIKIQPFARPPSLPAHFYEASVSTLLRALGCVLREEPLYVDVDLDLGGEGGGGRGPGPGRPCASSPKSAADPMAAAAAKDQGAAVEPGASPMDLDEQAPMAAAAASPDATAKPRRRRPMSREELYRLVEDLVTHNYGPRLYDQVLRAMDGAALTCLRRMVGVAPGCIEVNASGDGGNGNGKAVLFVPDGGAASSATPGGGTTTTASSSAGIPPGSAGAGAGRTAGPAAAPASSEAILDQIHKVCASYYEYLRCVRSVFLHLDRRFVFLPGSQGGDWKR